MHPPKKLEGFSFSMSWTRDFLGNPIGQSKAGIQPMVIIFLCAHSKGGTSGPLVMSCHA